MSDRPNLLLIWTDEQRADTMACYGNDNIQTPNMNRLASESFVFENAYCAQPVCTPSRATIMSGLYPHTHGCVKNNTPLPRETKTIAELAGDDWRRAYFGKWHLGDEISAQHGFDDWVSCEDGMYRDFYSDPQMLERRSDYHHYLLANGFVPDSQMSDGAEVFSRNFSAVMAEPFTKAGFLGRRAADYISQQSADQPFMLSVNFLEPHMPFFGPYNDKHDPAAIPVAPCFGKPPGDDASLRNRLFSAAYRHQGFGRYPLYTDSDWRRLLANYYGLASLVDDAVGRMLDALEASGLAENTIVVYTSDHGEMMGDHGNIAKCVMYEQSVRIPLLMRVPQLSRKQTMVPGRISQIDLVPTVLDLLGCDLPEHLQGVSRSNVLHGHDNLANNDVIIEWNAMKLVNHSVPGFDAGDIDRVNRQNWRTIVSHEGWKFNLSDDDTPELFDLNTDPYEMTNLAGDSTYAEVMRDLCERIAAWQTRTGDTLALPA